MQSDTTSQIVKALIAFAKSEIKIRRDKTGQAGGSRKYQYASLDAVIAEIRTPLADCGLFVSQTGMMDTDGTELLATTIHHDSGEWIRGVQPLHIDGSASKRNDSQAHGAAMTYSRRYALAAALGLALEEDDDAQSLAKPASTSNGNKVVPLKKPAKPNAELLAEKTKNFIDAVRDISGGSASDVNEVVMSSGYKSIDDVKTTDQRVAFVDAPRTHMATDVLPLPINENGNGKDLETK